MVKIGICPECKGKGRIPESDRSKKKAPACPACKGKGVVLSE